MEKILSTNKEYARSVSLLVGNQTQDDAAVFDIGGGKSIISTTDFFTPIVDNPYDFGRIASVNAISDIYAMGGKPIMAIAILGWPVEKLSLESAQQVIEGARDICQEAGISLAGGHSIEISDPIFGLAVTGVINTNKVKKNSSAKVGDKLFITKPLGIGIIATAEKNGNVLEKDRVETLRLMTKLNRVGTELSDFSSVSAITDITGFGLLGHLLEICEGSNVNAVIDFDKVPQISGLQRYIDLKTFPGGLFNNYKSYGHKISEITKQQKYVLCDPQTSGGLLVSVAPNGVKEINEFMKINNHPFYEIGELKQSNSNKIAIEVI